MFISPRVARSLSPALLLQKWDFVIIGIEKCLVTAQHCDMSLSVIAALRRPK